MNLRSQMSLRAKEIFKKGETEWYSCFSGVKGARWIVKYNNRYYNLVHDGTENGHIHDREPREISEATAKKICINVNAWSRVWKKFGWTEKPTDGEIDSCR